MIFKKIRRWFRYNPPVSASIADWRKFDKAFKKNAPIRYFIVKDLDRWFRLHISLPIKDAWWWVKYRVHPRHRMHVVDTKLKPDYHSTPTIMLYSMFSIIEDFVEIELDSYNREFKKYRSPERGIKALEELADPSLARSMSKDCAEAHQEILDLYLWWKEHKKVLEKIDRGGTVKPPYPLEDESEEDTFSFSFRDETVLTQTLMMEWVEKGEAMEDYLRKVENDMMIRACFVRMYFWS